MINKKTWVIITIAALIVLVCVLVVFFKYKKPIQQSTIITGLTEGQQTTFQQDLSGAMKQFGYIKKGEKLLAEGKVDDAIKEYQTALSLAKTAGTKGEALRSLADLYEKRRDYKKALEYITIEADKYIAGWAKGPIVERSKYLRYASEGEYELAIDHAQKAIDEQKKITEIKASIDEYNNRLEDLKNAKDYILSLKKQ